MFITPSYVEREGRGFGNGAETAAAAARPRPVGSLARLRVVLVGGGSRSEAAPEKTAGSGGRRWTVDGGGLFVPGLLVLLAPVAETVDQHAKNRRAERKRRRRCEPSAPMLTFNPQNAHSRAPAWRGERPGRPPAAREAAVRGPLRGGVATIRPRSATLRDGGEAVRGGVPSSHPPIPFVPAGN